MRGFLAKTGLTSLPIPVLKRKEDVLIKVHAFGINGPDLMQHKGLYPPPKGVTDVLGLEASGTIVQAADSTLVGQDVACLVPGGAYAEYCIARKDLCFPVPSSSNLSLTNAAAVPETLFTVFKNVFMSDLVSPASKVLFHGASGGIGSTGIILAKHMGLTEVYGTASGADRCLLTQDMTNARSVSNLAQSDWQATLPKMDLIVDVLGGPIFSNNLSLLDTKGTLVLLGFLGDHRIQNNTSLSKIILKELKITGSVLRPLPESHKISLRNKIHATLWDDVLTQKLRVPAKVTQYLGITETEHALEQVRQRRHLGKVVVLVS